MLTVQSDVSFRARVASASMEWLKIGEVARRTGLTPRTLRHYDDLGLLVPSGRSGGDYRLYGRDDLDRLLAIQHLKSLGLSLEQIAQALDDEFDPADVLDQHIAAVESRIAAERDLLTRLERLRVAATRGWDEVLDVIALTERLRHPDAGVRFRAALDDPTHAPLAELLDVLRGEPEAGVREVVTWAIVQHGPEAVNAVLAELDHPDAGVRRQMAHVLSKLGDRRAVGPLVGLLGDPDAGVVAKAVFALGQVGGPDAVAALAGLLGRGSTTVRATVVTALSGLGEAALESVLSRADDPSPATRADAAEVLGTLDDARAVPALSGLATDDNEDVRVAALMALSAIGGSAAELALRASTEMPGRTGALARRLTAERTLA